MVNSKFTPEAKLKKKEETIEKKKTTKKEVDMEQVWSCPICGNKHRIIHVEPVKTVKHLLQNTS